MSDVDFDDDEFIDDSSPEDEPEEEEPEKELFLTATLGQTPDLLEMPPATPAYDVLPVTEITRALISAVSSLLLFGRSSVGTTVPGTIDDLSRHSIRIREKFPLFVQDIRKRMNTKEYRMQRVYHELKQRIDKMTTVNQALKSAVRTRERRLLPNRTEVPDMVALQAEVKAAAGTLRQAIERIQSSRAAVRAAQQENVAVQTEIDDTMQAFRRRCQGEIGDKQCAIARLEVGLAGAEREHQESLARGQECIDEIERPIRALELRVRDMERRVIMANPQPKRNG
jgi:uncharacterized protein YukE